MKKYIKGDAVVDYLAKLLIDDMDELCFDFLDEEILEIKV